MGPSGNGQNHADIGGQLYPVTGTVIVDDKMCINCVAPKLNELRKRMGMLFQSGALLTDMNVFDNVAFPLRDKTHLTESI